jgi:hypothetical protein
VLVLIIGMCLQSVPNGISFKVLKIKDNIVFAQFHDGSYGKVLINDKRDFKQIECFL